MSKRSLIGSPGYPLATTGMADRGQPHYLLGMCNALPSRYVQLHSLHLHVRGPRLRRHGTQSASRAYAWPLRCQRRAEHGGAKRRAPNTRCDWLARHEAVCLPKWENEKEAKKRGTSTGDRRVTSRRRKMAARGMITVTSFTDVKSKYSSTCNVHDASRIELRPGKCASPLVRSSGGSDTTSTTSLGLPRGPTSLTAGATCATPATTPPSTTTTLPLTTTTPT
jgi:hypothetical protein